MLIDKQVSSICDVNYSINWYNNISIFSQSEKTLIKWKELVIIYDINFSLKMYFFKKKIRMNN